MLYQCINTLYCSSHGSVQVHRLNDFHCSVHCAEKNKCPLEKSTHMHIYAQCTYVHCAEKHKCTVEKSMNKNTPWKKGSVEKSTNAQMHSGKSTYVQIHLEEK